MRQKKWAGGYVDRESGYYYVRRQINGNKVHFSTKCKTLAGAVEAMAAWESNPEAYSPGADLAKPASMGWDDAVAAYLDYSLNVRGNTQKHVKEQSARFGYLSTYFEKDPPASLSRISAGLMDAYVSWRRQGGLTGSPVGQHSIALDVATIKAMTAWAVRSGALTVDPLASYPIPSRPKDSAKVRVFDAGWWEKVRPFMPPEGQYAGDVLLGSGMRWSSLTRLDRDDIDVEHGTIRLRGNLIKGKSGVTVYVTSEVARSAANWVLLGKGNSVEMNRMLRRACKAASVPYFSVHSFRHTAASMAIEDGVVGKALQARLAHASFATTERYIHALGGAQEVYRGRV